MKKTSSPKLLVTGGGTGGHIFAGVAIADEWKKKYPDASILFVGAKGGVEERLVPKSGYSLQTLTLGSLKGSSWGKRLRTFFQIPFALITAARILVSERPHSVIGVGGYASGPVVLIARCLSWTWGGCRTAILEQNAVPGFTNRILARFAETVFCAFPGIERSFPLSKTCVSGNPVRKTMVAMPPATRRPFVIFIFGGSQGAVGINTLVLEALPLIRDILPQIEIIHQTGEVDYPRVLAGYEKIGVQARIEKFIYDMPECYLKSSLVICRAGSSTLSELAAVHRASILIPFPFASDNHQEKNAQLFVDRGASHLLVQNRSQGKDLADRIRSLFTDEEQLHRMEVAAATLFSGNPQRIIVDRLYE